MADMVGGNREYVLNAAESFIGTDLGRKNAEYYMIESGAKLFGFIPFLAEELEVKEFLDLPLARSLIGDEGEFGKNAEYTIGLQEDMLARMFVKRNDKVMSFYYPTKGIGFLIIMVC
jgi:hypothetical protein